MPFKKKDFFLRFFFQKKLIAKKNLNDSQKTQMISTFPINVFDQFATSSPGKKEERTMRYSKGICTSVRFSRTQRFLFLAWHCNLH